MTNLGAIGCALGILGGALLVLDAWLGWRT